MTTPTLPSWIRDFRAPSYTSIYELCPEETRLFGTESIYGDWDGQLLLLAKDFAPRRLIDERIAGGDPRPYRHEPTLRTNVMLQRYVADMPCGMLYGSALAGLLRNDGRMSGTLPDIGAVMPWAERVLNWTLSQMPNVRAVACLGADAWRCASGALGVSAGEWKERRESGTPASARGLTIFAMAHPSRFPGGKARIEEDWSQLHERMAHLIGAAA